MIIHVVQRGDSLYALTKRYGISERQIIEDNRLINPDRLMIGQALVINTNTVRHTIRPGDTLHKLARQYNTTVTGIQSANPSLANPNNLSVGQVIAIPIDKGKLGTIEVNGYAFPHIDMDTLNKTLPNLTYLSIFSYQVNENGSLRRITDGSLIQAARRRKVAPLMVITNIREGGGFDSDIAHAILTNTQAQNTLIDNIINVLEKGYYGLDIDFEYIFPQDRENYNSFLRKAVNRLHPLGYTVSTALAPKISGEERGILYEAHDYPAHGSIVDHVILMTYEWGYTYSSPQAVAPIKQIERVLQYAVSVIPSKKILMGIPNYGYDWTLPYVQGTAARSISNTQAVNLAVKMGAEIKYDKGTQSPYFNYTDNNGRQHVVWFEDARSIEAKLKLVSKYNLGGVSYWTINSYFPQNWIALKSMYNIKKVQKSGT